MWSIYRFAVTIADTRRSKLLARKGILYASGVTFVQMPSIVWAIVRVAFGIKNETATTISALLIPLAGFFNALVFLVYRRDMKTKYGKQVRKL